MKQVYRKGLFVRIDLNPYEIVCKYCNTDIVFTLDECNYRNKGIRNEYLGTILCPCCHRKNVVHREDKFKQRKEED